MYRKMQVFGGLALGLIAGAVIGSGAALLSTPQNGNKTRAMLKEKGEELRCRAAASLQETRMKADAVIADVRSRSAEIGRPYSRSGGNYFAQEILAE